MGCLQIASLIAVIIASIVGVLEVEHAKFRPVQKALITAFAAFLDRFQDVSDNLQWATDFNGALLPTEPTRELPLNVISGLVPENFSGVYLRVGPNTVNWPPQKRTHVFDGDGMVYSVRFKDGKATFHCDYIKTPKYLFEKRMGQDWFVRLGEFNGVSGLLKMLTVARWKAKYAGFSNMDTSVANTAIVYTPDNKIWALNQAGLPFRIHIRENGAIDSVGFDDLQGTLKEAMSAHPVIDYHTKETFFHGLDPQSQRLYAGRIAEGVLKEQTDLKADPPVGMGFNHDMFITKDYVVVIDGSMRFDIGSVLQGSSLWNFDTTQRLRFGVYPRAARNMTAEAFVWIEAPFPAEIVHKIFAQNVGDKITLWTSLCEHDANRTEGVLGGMGLLHVTQLIIDVSERSVRREDIDGSKDFIAEFGRVREDRVGSEARFGYTAAANPHEGWKDFNFTGLLKWDFAEKRIAGEIRFPPGVIGGEPVFVPQGPIEDDGYISLFLWNSATQNTTFVLYNATTFSQSPVVELSVPWHVPLGFHAWWLGEHDLRDQAITS